jgi:diacylglycerol kinase (ATP)
MKSDSWWKSLGFATQGVLYAVKTERNLKIHIFLAIAVLFISLFFDLAFLEYVIFAITITLVIASELFNTAIEYTIDALIPEKSETARVIKDVSAGAVLVTAFGAIFVGYFVLFDRMRKIANISLDNLPNLPDHIAVISLFITICFVVIFKTMSVKGVPPLIGGMPSGHAAISFSILVSIVYITKDFLVILLVTVLALLVSHSRIQLNIHTLKEVTMGGILGAAITYFIYVFFL